MIRKLIAALLAFVASAAFAAIDINKATQADLESIKGIGEGSAAKFSADGLTVNDKAFRTTAAGNAAEARASAKTGADTKADRKTDAKPDAKPGAKADPKADVKPMTQADAKTAAPAATKSTASAPTAKK